MTPREEIMEIVRELEDDMNLQIKWLMKDDKRITYDAAQSAWILTKLAELTYYLKQVKFIVQP